MVLTDPHPARALIGIIFRRYGADAGRVFTGGRVSAEVAAPKIIRSTASRPKAWALATAC
ncbi:MAG: hypothetical protein BGO92_15225 [Magnetospirillum sp. 64-120]|nr:MAG: hypothetical protein BGO92_15225 [Magnetospirillum sp. 64-120]